MNIEHITTADAAKITHYANATTFRRWARKNCRHVLHRAPGRRGYLVDREKLLNFLQHYTTPYDTHVRSMR